MANQEIKYPEIEVDLCSIDGNAFSILSYVSKAMQRGGVPKDIIAKFRTEAMSGSYDELLQTCMKWVSVS